MYSVTEALPTVVKSAKKSSNVAINAKKSVTLQVVASAASMS